MKHLLTFVLVAAASVLLPTLTTLAGDDDEFQKYGQKYLAAKAEGDIPLAFDMVLKADAIQPNDILKAEALIMAYTSLTRDPRTGQTYEDLNERMKKGIPAAWAERIPKCPIPGDTADGLDHLEYSIIVMALACHYHNANRDLDSASAALALSEKHLGIAGKKDPTLKAMAAETGYTRDYAAMREQLGKNRMALAYERARGTFKALQDFTGKYAPEKDAESSGGGTAKTPATKPAVVKTFRVRADARGNERREDIEATGSNTVTVEGEGGTYLVSYAFNYPGRYLIKGGGDLGGKDVRVYFEDGKATGISSGVGSGVCRITRFEKR